MLDIKASAYLFIADAPVCVVGTVFVVAAVLKILQPSGIQRALHALGLDRFPHFLVALVLFELLLGFTLLTGVGGAYTIAVAVVTLLAFILIHIRLVRSGFRDGCGCFGESVRSTATWNVPFRNAVLILLLVTGAMVERKYAVTPSLFGGGLGVGAVILTVVHSRARERTLFRVWQIDT